MEYSFLFINFGGDLESIAMRVKEEGYPIYFYKTPNQVKGREDTGVGIFDKKELVSDMFSVLNKFHDNKKQLIILIDDNGRGEEIDYLRSEGWQVIGGSAFGDKIEIERSQGIKLMEAIGLKMPDYKFFNTISEGLNFVESIDTDARYVFKPEGEDFAGSAKTYTAKNKQDLIDYMRWIEADMPAHNYVIEKYVLQEFVEGIEADFETMFDGEKFMEGSTAIDIEEKKSGDGNKGEATGCMGNVELYLKQTKFFDTYTKKLVPLLKKVNYVGPISINCIFAKGDSKHKAGDAYGLEFTSRFGWDATLTQMELIKSSGQRICDWMIAIITRAPFKFPHNLVGCGVRVYSGSISMKKDEVSGRFFSFDKAVKDHLWYYSVSKKNGSWTIEDNPVLVANTAAPTVKGAIKMCYDLLDKIKIPDSYYRMEIGQRAPEVLRFLAEYGWI